MSKRAKSARKRIEHELADVRRAIEAIRNEESAQELEGFGDNTPLSEEGDKSLVAEERELGSDRLGRLHDRAAALDEALHRINDGDYGTCVACGGTISEERLEAVPEAVRCVKCQEEAEGEETHRETHAHEWKRAEEVARVQRESEEGAPTTGRHRPPRNPGP
jgi:DnaK suppressor protein